MSNNVFSAEKKDKKKVRRTIVEIIILIISAYVIINAFITFKKFQPVKDEFKTYDNGFIALSYFGVDRTQKGTLIDNDMLGEHLTALKASGYETISQQDVVDYYTKGKKLPKKALYLAFEDGRRDSSLFTQPILEDLNYRATMFSYADKFAKDDLKFLMPEALLKMKESTFWELGTNGYRLEYINVFDRYNNFLNVLNSNEFTMMAPYIDKNYNHYLMDFIKDEDGVPVEDVDGLDKRITYDYKTLASIYKESLGFVPYAYVLMHANSPYYGTSSLAGKVNARWINELFKMNFNREGSSFNRRDSGVYNLTRLQPQPYWYTNHILMRIWDDTKMNMAFVSGDKSRQKNWDTVTGKSEFRKNVIVLTSPPRKEGLMRLNNSESYKNIRLATSLKGNVIGLQELYLRCDPKMESYIKICLKDNNLYVYEKTKTDGLKKLYSIDLRKHDEIINKSLAEDKLEGEVMADKTILKYSNSNKEMNVAVADLNKKKDLVAPRVEEGAKEYVPRISDGKKGNRHIENVLNGNSLSIYIDEKKVVDNLKISATIQAGSICLGSLRSEVNEKDDVYDGVFEDLVVTQLQNNEVGKILYDNRLNFGEKITYDVSTTFNSIVDWFIETF